MNRSLSLSLLALTMACRATPVLSDTVEEADTPLPSASVAPSVATSAPAPPPLLYPNVVAFSGFPRCPPARPPEPEEPLVWIAGDSFKPLKHKPHDDDDWPDVRELALRLEACFQRTLREPAKFAATVGILPSGTICAPKMVSTVPLPAKCVTCLTQRFGAYRFPAGNGNPGLTFNLPAFTPTTR